jgi:hypothetical protein
MWVHPTLLSMQRVRACVLAGWLAVRVRRSSQLPCSRAAATASVAHSCSALRGKSGVCWRVGVWLCSRRSR